MQIHFIAIGGAVMHNLAIALHKKGYAITGSDDEIFEPSRSRLDAHDLLPPEWGWFPGKLNHDLNAVILGMHAREDNPELIRARELGIKIFSFPEFLYEQTKNKKRVVIAGSHGKTTVTSMIMHVLRENGLKFDYMVGSNLEGFDTMVELDNSNEVAIFEGDEYLTSPIDKRPKFHLYHPHISLITGIAWDHMNVFPTFENYKEQFMIFAGMTTETLIYFEGDIYLKDIAERHRKRVSVYPYNEVISCTHGKMTMVTFENMAVSLSIFGRHNMQNMAGAMQVCKFLGVSERDFLFSMTNFRGAARRQELLAGNENYEVYLDFAHAPSKVKATVEAFREQFPGKRLVTCLELHTFSSLNRDFLPQYHSSLDKADKAIVFYDPEVVSHKKLPEIQPETIIAAFGREDMVVISNKTLIEAALMSDKIKNSILLLMTSGNLSGIDLSSLAERYINT
jgi:UDP-N-acetylmuramate: L-alanyl-gamma-D-glutamyl-meso-diaminopimelate ligase